MGTLPLVFLEGAAAIGSGITASRLFAKQTTTVRALIGKLDKKLARRMFRLVELNQQRCWTARQNRQFWMLIGGVRGIPHLIAQVRLMLRIVAEIRKTRPDLFEFEQVMLDGATRSVVLGVLKSLGETVIALFFPHLRCIGAKVTSTVYAHLAAEVENIIAESEYGYPPM